MMRKLDEEDAERRRQFEENMFVASPERYELFKKYEAGEAEKEARGEIDDSQVEWFVPRNAQEAREFAARMAPSAPRGPARHTSPGDDGDGEWTSILSPSDLALMKD